MQPEIFIPHPSVRKKQLIVGWPEEVCLHCFYDILRLEGNVKNLAVSGALQVFEY